MADALAAGQSTAQAKKLLRGAAVGGGPVVAAIEKRDVEALRRALAAIADLEVETRGGELSEDTEAVRAVLIADPLSAHASERIRAPCRSRTRIPRSSRRFRRSRTTASCRTARPARSSLRAARSSGCACPRYDGPSVFGALLDRDAGTFRLGPADTMVPAARRYLPGTMILETSWGTDRGWVIVRDVLLVGPWHDTEERSTTHRRAPTDYDADHVLLRTVRCVNGSVEVQLECDPIFDYGRRYAHWEYVGEGYNEAVATADGWPTKLTLTTDLRVGFEGSRVRALTTLRDGDTAFVALAFSDHPGPEDLPAGLRPPGQDRRLLAPVARARDVPGPSVAPVPAALGAHAEGPDLLAHRRDDRRRDHLACPRPRAASATGTTATRGCATARSCSGACTRSASSGRPTTTSTSCRRSPSPTTCR